MRGVRRRLLAGCLAAAVACAAVGPVPLAAQEAPDAAALAAADSARTDLVQPPGEHGTDWVDVAEFPLKVVAFPLSLVFVRLPGYVAGVLTVPRPPTFLVRAYRDMSAWGLRPGVVTQIGPRSGVGLELQFDRYAPFYASSAISFRESQRHRAGFRLSGAAGSIGAEAGWHRDAEVRFHGIGSQTRDEEDESFYSRDYWEVGASGELQVFPVLRVDVGGAYEHNEIDDPISSGETSLFERFVPEDLFGALEETKYLRLDGGVTLDLTKRREFQRRGIRLRGGGSLYEGVDDTDSDFHVLNGQAAGYLPLNGRQVLALSAEGNFARSDGGQGVPFFHLSRLGGTSSALGFSNSRFHDNDMVALQAEWRYEVWRDIHNTLRSEFFLYFGEGAVTSDIEDLSTDDWRASFGFGARLASLDRLLGLAFFGWSDESVHAGVRGQWPF
ncbi:MAG: BamA/TamA family outer membrane protein [Gemmatimonadota bacterium]|nr:BamA/TamA family outer membrane protein [Gemmatimonadota bacterium]